MDAALAAKAGEEHRDEAGGSVSNKRPASFAARRQDKVAGILHAHDGRQRGRVAFGKRHGKPSVAHGGFQHLIHVRHGRCTAGQGQV